MSDAATIEAARLKAENEQLRSILCEWQGIAADQDQYTQHDDSCRCNESGIASCDCGLAEVATRYAEAVEASYLPDAPHLIKPL